MQGVSLRRVPQGKPGAGMAVLRLHYSADPERWPADAVAKLRGTYTSDARWNREMEIQYEALEGELLYPQFSRDRNLCRPFDVSDPNYWSIWMALDPHARTAHAMVWEAFNKHNDRFVCGELWPEFGTRYGPKDGVRWTTRDYAQAIQLFESDSNHKPIPFRWANGKRLKVHRRFMDTYGKGANSDEGEDYFETYRNQGIKLLTEALKEGKPSQKVRLVFDPALKGHENLEKAYDAIGAALASRRDAGGNVVRPAMMVSEECVETIDELENVRFPEGTPERAVDERPITYQKHCLDCLAYIETGGPRFVLPRRVTNPWQPIYDSTGY